MSISNQFIDFQVYRIRCVWKTPLANLVTFCKPCCGITRDTYTCIASAKILKVQNNLRLHENSLAIITPRIVMVLFSCQLMSIGWVHATVLHKKFVTSPTVHDKKSLPEVHEKFHPCHKVFCTLYCKLYSHNSG